MTGVSLTSPEYEISELDNELLIVIHASLSKPKEAAFILEKDCLIFDSSPYFLKIRLPHAVSDRAKEQIYDSETGSYKIKLVKIADQLESSEEEENIPNELWNFGISTKESNSENKEIPQQYYGFVNKYTRMFGKLFNEFSGIINLDNPDSTCPADRTQLRIAEENQKWDENHYLADTMETDHLDSIFHYEMPWVRNPVKELSDDMKKLLGSCKNVKKLMLSDELKQLSEFQIVDILLAYAYNKRTTEGDHSVESGWTINKLSSTLSWFEVFKNLKTVILAFYRRSLTYPLYRNWNLTELVHQDVVKILKLGTKQVTHCLLEVKEIFNESDNRYILNTLYVTDLCRFAYLMTDERLYEISKIVEETKIRKYEVNKELPLLEIAAHLTMEEEEKGASEKGISDIVDKISKLDLKNKSEPSSSGSTDSSESDSDDNSTSEPNQCS